MILMPSVITSTKLPEDIPQIIHQKAPQKADVDVDRTFPPREHCKINNRNQAEPRIRPLNAILRPFLSLPFHQLKSHSSTESTNTLKSIYGNREETKQPNKAIAVAVETVNRLQKGLMRDTGPGKVSLSARGSRLQL